MYVVMGTEYNEVLLWDAETGAEPTTAQAPLMSLAGHEEAKIIGQAKINWACCAFSPDSARIATGSAADYCYEFGQLRIWDALTGATLMTLKGHDHSVDGCAFSPDGTLIATASEDATVKIWVLKTGVAMRTFDAHSRSVYACAFSPDGTRVVSCDQEGTARIWNTKPAMAAPPAEVVDAEARVTMS